MATTSVFEREGVDDLVLLPKVTEEGIVDNINKRYMLDKIYTNIGPVLLSINPFRLIPGICDIEQVDDYRNRFRHEVPPNIFALAEEAYRAIKNQQESQCVIISGESGAGKTEAAKLIMKYVSAVSGESEEINYVKDVIFQSNPLLEAFGNAKTLRNNNSSRFGKYFEIQFDRLGDPVGGKINHYLLEKSRVVRQIPGERCFHIFYNLLAGANQQDRNNYQLREPSSYHYLNQSQCYTVDGMDDVQDFNEVVQAMDIIGITKEEQSNIWGMLSGILNLGNISFNCGSDDVSSVKDENQLKLVAKLFSCNAEKLKNALISRVINSGSGTIAETYVVPNNLVQADAARDSLAKTIYSRIFDFLIEKTNIALEYYKTPFSCVIGVLDIYGFEIFDNNGFEQFCINYVNEKLQQYFIELTLKAEQEEYKSENIQWTPIKFFNNKEVCDLIEGKAPPGLFSVLDDVCYTMHAIGNDSLDSKFVEKARGYFSGHLHFRTYDGGFEVKHYAGEVAYNATGFCDRNKDSITNDLIDAIQSSSNRLLVSFFPEDTTQKQTKRPTTAGYKIKTSAQSLIQKLSACFPHYVRTIKPNETKRPKDWDQQRVQHQVKYLGLLENVRVRRAGFAYRAPYERFVNRYKKLSPDTWGLWGEWSGDPKQGCELILSKSALDGKQWQLGRTKIFIRHPESLFFLEECLERFDYERAAMIQKAWRNWKGKKKALEARAKAASLLRGKKERRRDTINKKFEGDYINYDKNFSVQQGLGRHREERILFSDQVIGFSKRGRPQRRDFVISDKGFYVLHRASKNRQTTYKLDRATGISAITAISLSELQDNHIVIHAEGNDLWIESEKKTELITVLNEQYEILARSKLNLQFGNNIRVQLGPNDSRQLTFVKDESASRSKLRKKDKTMTIGVSTGLDKNTDSTPTGMSGGSSGVKIPPSTVNSSNLPKGNVQKKNVGGGQPKQQQSILQQKMQQQQQQQQPPQQQQVNIGGGLKKGGPKKGMGGPKKAPPQPQKPRCQALFDYPGTNEGELPFSAGDIITIIQKDDAGWWEGELNGVKGWIPANYVQEI